MNLLFPVHCLLILCSCFSWALCLFLLYSAAPRVTGEYGCVTEMRLKCPVILLGTVSYKRQW